MKYSFVCIAYNEERSIARCINSILSLDELGESFEIIVVDDGSRDGTTEVVKKIMKRHSSITLLSDGKNHGRGFSRYIGTQKTSGEYVGMVDGDIILPPHWLKSCLENIDRYDAVGGIAVPDGDVAYIYNALRLQPKIVPHTITVSGGNGLYRKSVFKKLNFDPELKEGEDIDFNYRFTKAGLSSFCIPAVVVEHQEKKSFLRSMIWLYQSGVGATRQLLNFKEVRLPDVSFTLTMLTVLFGGVATVITSVVWWLMLPLLCVLGASFIHTSRKFKLHFASTRTIGAVTIDAIFILCYYAGRIAGLIVFLKNKSNTISGT